MSERYLSETLGIPTGDYKSDRASHDNRKVHRDRFVSAKTAMNRLQGLNDPEIAAAKKASWDKRYPGAVK